MRSTLAVFFCVLMVSPSLARTFTPAQFTPTAIRNISRDEVVTLADGAYHINDDRRDALQDLPDGVTIRAENRYRAVLGQFGDTTQAVNFRNKNGIRIEGLRFVNIRIEFNSCDKIVLNRNRFYGYENKIYDVRQAVIQVRFSLNTTLFHNEILWTKNTRNNRVHQGGVSGNAYLGNVVGITLRDSRGGKHSIEQNNIQGFLRTGILYWENNNTPQQFAAIKDNNIVRFGEAPGSNAQAKGEDHGIYALFGSNLRITGNTVRGWSQSGAGGSVKIKFYNIAEITNNRFYDSGIIFRDKVENLFVVGNKISGAGGWAANFFHPSSDTVSRLHFKDNDLGGGQLSMGRPGVVRSSDLNQPVTLISGDTVTGGVMGNRNGTLQVPQGTRNATSRNNNRMTIRTF